MIRQSPKLPNNVNIELVNYGESDTGGDQWAYIVFNNVKEYVYLLSLDDNFDFIYRKVKHAFPLGETWLDAVKIWYANVEYFPNTDPTDETTYDLVYNLREAEDQLRPPSLHGYYFSKRLNINNEMIFILKPDEKGAPGDAVRFKYSEGNWSIDSLKTTRTSLVRVAADLLQYFQDSVADGPHRTKDNNTHYIVKAGEFSNNPYWKTKEGKVVNLD